MTKPEQIHNWLTIGLQQPTDRLSEIFYYDKRDNEFFSILVTDYFMLDEKFNIAKDTITTYTKGNLETLIDRIRRIENKEETIISVPRLGNLPNDRNTEFISDKVESFLNLNSINIETATIWIVEESVTITIDLKNESKPMSKKPWWKVWK
ncbi:MAG: hypothetical protein ACEQSR_11895 [Candidatus Methylacidiphilales bacterium]